LTGAFAFLTDSIATLINDVHLAPARATRTIRAMLDPELDEAIRARLRDADFWTWMGMTLSSLDQGRSEIRLDLRPHHLNPGGITHGGVIAAVLDAAAGLAHRTEIGIDASHVTIDLNVNYLKPARSAVLIARGRSLQSGERIGYAEATLLDESEAVLARATATFLIIPSGDRDSGEDSR
jgi:uncharacterized protein (TIGR00369 family)